ncbi:MAG: alpha/beta fold hydrolase [Chromatiales bacterium]|nr:alpha/beta fold hydrolase [Chromatiales bacterium]
MKIEPEISVPEFSPPRLWRGAHAQSVLASAPLRRPLVERRARDLIEASSDVILDCGRGVRLHGYYSPRSGAPEHECKGLVVLIHGWEGSADSLYLLSTASHLRRRGYDVFRLNMRDHGPSHHLNTELFHSNRIAEVVGAVRSVQERFEARPLFLAGFSLGGNFALRVAMRAPARGIDLRQVVSICPVLNPETTLEALETGWFGYRQYFLLKWRRSLLKKAQAFPDRYDFSHVGDIETITDLTAFFVEHYSGFPDLSAYLRGYALTGNALEALQVPCHIIAAQDDPVIPSHDMAKIARPSSLVVTMTERGGHCGYVEDYRLRSWAERQIGDLFDRAADR